MEDSIDNTESESASCLAQIVQDHPKLAELIETWFLEYCNALSEKEQVVIRKLLGQKE